MTHSTLEQTTQWSIAYKNGQLRIVGEMTIYTCVAVRRKLLARLKQHRSARALDLSGITQLDTAGLQLLLSTCRQAVTDGGGLVITNPSSAVTEILNMCNASTLFSMSSTELRR